MPNKISFVESEMLRGMARGGAVDDLSKPSFRIAAPKSGKRRGVVPRGTSVLDVPEGKERRIPDTVLRRPPTPPDTITGYDPSMAQRHAESLAGALTPKIGGPRAQAISQTLLGGPESALPLGIGLQELVPFSPYVAEDAGRLVAQGVQEGSPLTTGLGAGLGVLQASPAIGPLARGAKGMAQRAAAAADPEVIRRYVAATQGVTGLPGTAVVKPKGLGGNWPAGDVERVTNPLKERVEGEIVTPEMAREHWDVASVDLSRKLALNQWIDQKLNRYIKNEMATPEDPVRRLAEQSRVTHLPSVSVAEGAPEMPLEHYSGWLRGPALVRITEKREREGFPIWGINPSQYTGEIPSPERVLGTNMGRGWENIADQAVDIEKAVDYQGIPANTEQLTKALDNYTAIRDDIASQFEASVNGIPGLSEAEKASTIKGAGFGYMANMLGRYDEFKDAEQAVRKARIGFSNAERKLFAENPWIANVEPEARIYKLAEGQDSNRLGFNYIIDALRDDLAAGRISPEQLSKVTMEQAVRRTQEYNLEMAKKAADAAVKARVGLPVYKEYPEGYRWVELNRPGAFAFESDAMGHSVRGYEPPKGHPDWLPESGDQGTLGYGRGGWEGIKSGKAKVYSLVDPQGKSKATIEVHRGDVFSGIDKISEAVDYAWWQELNDKERSVLTRKFGGEDEALKALQDFGFANHGRYVNDPETVIGQILDKFSPSAAKRFAQSPKLTDELFINQIKGSGKKDPTQKIGPEDAHLLPYIQDFVLGGEWEGVNDLANTGLKEYFKVFDKSEVEKLRQAGHKVPPYLSDSEAKRLQDELYKIETGKNPDTGLPMAAGGRVEAPEGAEDFIAQVQQRMQGQEQRMAGGGIVKKALGTLSKEADALKPTFKMPGPDMPLTKIPESAPKVTESVLEVKPGGAKAQKVTQSVIETPVSRRQVIKTAGSQVAQKVIPRISTDIPQLTPEEMFGGVADMPGLYAAMLPLVRRVAPHELDSMAKRLGFSLEDIIEHSGEDILPRGELVSEGVTRFMELFPETSSKVLKKAGGGGVARNASH